MSRVAKTNCAPMTKTSGLISMCPMGRINKRILVSMGAVSESNNGANGVWGLIQLNTACIKTAYKKMVRLMFITPTMAKPRSLGQIWLPATIKGKSFSHKVRLNKVSWLR